MTHTTPEVEEIVYEIDGIALSKPTSINGVLVQMWDRNVLTAYIESKLTTLTTKHQEEIEKAVEAERERTLNWVRDNAKELSDPYPFPSTYGYKEFVSASDLEEFLTPTKTDKQTEV